MLTSIEQHVEWIDHCIHYMREHEKHLIEPDLAAQEAWLTHVTRSPT